MLPDAALPREAAQFAGDLALGMSLWIETES